MLTYSRLGYRGNLGNQLFQVASLISLSEKHNQNYCIPKWKYSDSFDFEYHIGYVDESFLEIKEKKFTNYNELFRPLLLVAFGLLLIEVLLRNTILRGFI